MSKEKLTSITSEELKLTHDDYFREGFEIKRVAVAFLKKKLPKKTLDCLDLEKLVIESRHLIDEVFKKTFTDVMYRVPIKGTKGKKHVNFFVIIEHKSRQDYLTIFQLWGYVHRVCRREFLATPKRDREKVNYRLPPVIAIIVYHGESQFRGKTELSELFAPLPGLENYLPKLQAILVDLSTIDDDDPLMNDPEVPELRMILMTLKVIFRKDAAMKVKEVIEALRPYSDDPDMRRVIRMTWVYLANNARHLKRGFDTLLGTFEEVIGEKVMSTLVEMWKAEGKTEGKAEGKAEGVAEGEARGEIRATLKQRFNGVSQDIRDAIQSITDLVALESLLAHAESCKSLDEFAEALR